MLLLSKMRTIKNEDVIARDRVQKQSLVWFGAGSDPQKTRLPRLRLAMTGKMGF